MARPAFHVVKAEAKCPACGDQVKVQTTMSLYQLATTNRVKVTLASVNIVHICPAVVPSQRRRSE